MRYIQSFNNSGSVQTAIDNNFLASAPSVAADLSSNKIMWNTPKVYAAMPLTFEVQEAGDIYWGKARFATEDRTIYYKLNDGEWTSIKSNRTPKKITVASGDTIQFKGDYATYGSADGEYGEWDNLAGSFSGTTAKCKIYGNIMSLVNSTGFTNETGLTSAGTFAYLFANANIQDAYNLVLPADKLKKGCYQAMFANNPDMHFGPLLPSTVFKGWADGLTYEEIIEWNGLDNHQNCYKELFSGCTNLAEIRCNARIITLRNIFRADVIPDWTVGVQTVDGAFYKNPDEEYWNLVQNGVPANWTIEDLDI